MPNYLHPDAALLRLGRLPQRREDESREAFANRLRKHRHDVLVKELKLTRHTTGGRALGYDEEEVERAARVHVRAA